MLTGGASAAVDSWEAEPATAGLLERDALLAAVAAHQFDLAGREAPAWTQIPPLEPPCVFEHPFSRADRVVAQTPNGWVAEASTSQRATW